MHRALRGVASLRGRLSLPLLIAALSLIATRGSAQYPVIATPVLSLSGYSTTPKLAGYVSVRETVQRDTATMTVNHARLGLVALPLPYVAVKLQGDFAAVGRTVGDTVPAMVLTDAFLQFTLPEAPGAAPRTIRPAVIVGQFRTPFAIEYLTPSTIFTTIEHSQAGELISTRRDIGFMASVDVAGRFVASGAVVNGEGANRPSNPDGTQMLIGRVTVAPIPSLGLSALWLGEGDDHRWGSDLRWTSGGALLEGEVLRRKGPTSATARVDASGGYAMAAYRVLPWLQPVVKWERLDRQSTTSTGASEAHLTWLTYAVNVLAPVDRVRLQIDWIAKAERPAGRGDEFIAQLQATF
ncbi:MAG: hypothetical protein NVS1B4_12620 [Gemmatimonadaceae bacterium]